MTSNNCRITDDLPVKKDYCLPIKLFLYDISASDLLVQETENKLNRNSMARVTQDRLRGACDAVRNLDANAEFSKISIMKWMFFDWITFDLEQQLILENGTIVNAVPNDWNVSVGNTWTGGVVHNGNRFVCNIAQSYDNSFTICLVDVTDRCITETLAISVLPDHIESNVEAECAEDRDTIRHIHLQFTLWIQTLFTAKASGRQMRNRQPYSLSSVSNSLEG